jgi:hypothetical protein
LSVGTPQQGVGKHLKLDQTMGKNIVSCVPYSLRFYSSSLSLSKFLSLDLQQKIHLSHSNNSEIQH